MSLFDHVPDPISPRLLGRTHVTPPLPFSHVTYCGRTSLRVPAFDPGQLHLLRAEQRFIVCGTCRLHAEQAWIDLEADGPF